MGNDDFVAVVGVVRKGFGADLSFFAAQPIFGEIGEQNVVICCFQTKIVCLLLSPTKSQAANKRLTVETAITFFGID